MNVYSSKIKGNSVFDKNTLIKRLNDFSGNASFYSYFLKRKRIEKGMKLEDVSSGICSISYLSRIENNQSKPDEDSLKLLFERLDLNYEEIKEKREHNVFEGLVKKELSQSKGDVLNEINSIIISNAYTSIELDLLVSYSSLLDKNYDETRFILSKQEVNLSLFNNYEMIFYIYLFCRYLHETNQNLRAYSQVKVLNSINLNNEFFKAVIFDISIDIAFEMGEYDQVVRFFYLLNQNEYNFYFNKKITLHKLQTLVANAKFNLNENLEEFDKIKKNLGKDDNTNTIYNYYLALAYYKNGLFKKSLEILKDILDYPKALALFAYLTKKTASGEYYHLFNDKYQTYNFGKYDYLYENMCEYVFLYLKGESNIHLFNYLKQRLISHNSLFYDYIIKDIALNELINLGIKTSKYKETLKYISEEQAKSLMVEKK